MLRRALTTPMYCRIEYKTLWTLHTEIICEMYQFMKTRNPDTLTEVFMFQNLIIPAHAEDKMNLNSNTFHFKSEFESFQSSFKIVFHTK